LYIGQEVVKRIEALAKNLSLADLRNMLTAKGTEGIGKWVDIWRLFSPASKINELVDSVKSCRIRSVDELYENLTQFITITIIMPGHGVLTL